jgi:glycine/D-amino acid oxidase-like deaminating enzyme
MDDIFAPGFREEPYWWEAAPRPSAEPVPLPARADAVIVGSGYTGLVAAMTLARAGRDVVVLDAEDPGWGASSRNAGFVGRALKEDFVDLIDSHGLAFARAAYGEVWAAYDYVFQIVREEAIECALQRCGRFIPVFSRRQYDQVARAMEIRNRYLRDDFVMVPRAEQHRHLGTDLYHGGVWGPERGAIHPGLYHQGLLDRARASGARVIGRTPVTGLGGDGGGRRVATARGTIASREVILATNGYTGPATPWFHRRVIPFHGFMIATEPLDPAVLARAMPGPRIVEDNRINIDFVRRSPDDTRLLFGGRTGGPARSLRAKARVLRAGLTRMFPDLAGVRLSHVWTGRCCVTFDSFPHVGVHDGVHYALGYHYMGVPMGTWLGRKVALKVLGHREAATAFDDRPFPSRPYYRGNPWFVPLAASWIDLRDRLAR